MELSVHSEYIGQRDGGYYVAGMPISLDSVVHSFNQGNSPEAIWKDSQLPKRAQIYGAIAFYLNHQAEIDKYLEGTEREFEASGIRMAQANPALFKFASRSRLS